MNEDPNLDQYLAKTLSQKSTQEPEPPRTTLSEALDEVERRMLIKAKTVCQNTREMAQMLGISQSSVVRKMAKHGIGAE